MQKLEIVYKNIDELLPYINNARTHDEIAIKYNSLIDIVNNFLRLQDAEKINAKNYPN